MNEETNKEKELLYFDPEILKQPTPQWMKDIGYIGLKITIKREGELKE